MLAFAAVRLWRNRLYRNRIGGTDTAGAFFAAGERMVRILPNKGVKAPMTVEIQRRRAMMTSAIAALGLLLLVFAAAAGAQEAFDKEVFAPFVSRLQATGQTSSILLTWRDSEDVFGDCLVFRQRERG